MQPTTTDRLDTTQAFRNLADFPYWRKAARAMEPLRKALGYAPRQEVIPTSPNVVVGARAIYDQRITLPAGSWLYAISGSSQQAEGFNVQITDFGSASTLFAAPINIQNLTGGNAPAGIVDASGAAVTAAWPLHLLNLPRPIPEPGIVNAQITNMSANTNRVQLVLWFLCPVPNQPRNRWNDELDAELDLFRRIVGGNVATQTAANGGQPAQDPAFSLPANNQAINATAVGALPTCNIVVSGVAGFRIAIHQLDLYNAANQQTIRLLSGADLAAIDLRGALTDYPAQGGYGLAYQAEPHFVCEDGAPFSVNLTDTQANGGGPVTGFCKYRLIRTWSPGGSGA